MNVALFLDCFYPMKNGVITSVMQLKEGLEKKGHHAVIASIQVKGYETSDPTIKLFPQIAMDFGSKQDFGLALAYPNKVVRFLKRHKIDLIHTHTEFGMGVAGLIAAKKLGLPRVATSHTLWYDYSNYNILLRSKWVVRKFMALYYTGVNAIIAPSIKSKRFNEEIVPRVKKYIVPNGIDFKSFKAKPVTDKDKKAERERLGIGVDDKVFVFVGRVGPEKRIAKLIGALAPLMVKNKSYKLLVIGDGPAKESMQRKAEALGVAKNVIFTGFINWERISLLYSLSDAFVSASLSEMHPMTYIEAAMSGLPLVVRRDASCEELVLDGENGYMCDTDDQIPEKIELFINDEKKLKKFSARSMEISDRFSSENFVNNVLNVYHEVLKEHENKKK
ncbi:MAG: glycosyltransferase [Spirochaetales bacterium]|nr:glycosyltransferase [Spirochaetales bacterium]